MNFVQRVDDRAGKRHGRVQRFRLALLSVALFVGFFVFFSAGKAFCNDPDKNWNRLSGPIPLINQSPIQLLFLQTPPDRAETYPQGKFSVNLMSSIANTLLWDQSGGYLGYVDTEIIRSSLELRYGILSRLEIGMSIPFLYGSGGFMDHGILEFEKLFGASRHLRENEDKGGSANQYTYRISRNGRVFIQGNNGSSGLGDIALRLKGKILNESDILPYVSARFSVKVPTGDEDRAFGSGAVDYGCGLLIQKTVLKRLTTYFNADVVFPGQAYKQVDVSLQTFYNLMLGTEVKLTHGLSFMAQLNYITRPFRDTGLDLLDSRIWDLLLGLSYVSKGGYVVQGGLVEDIIGSSDASADIVFFINVGKNF